MNNNFLKAQDIIIKWAAEADIPYCISFINPEDLSEDEAALTESVGEWEDGRLIVDQEADIQKLNTVVMEAVQDVDFMIYPLSHFDIDLTPEELVIFESAGFIRMDKAALTEKFDIENEDVEYDDTLVYSRSRT